MKNLKTGTKLNEWFSSSDYVEKVQLEQQNLRFVYLEGENLVLMDNETFEQILINKEILGPCLPFLENNMTLTIQFCEDKPLNAELPSTVIVEIMQTNPVIKSATVTSSYKPAIFN